MYREVGARLQVYAFDASCRYAHCLDPCLFLGTSMHVCNKRLSNLCCVRLETQPLLINRPLSRQERWLRPMCGFVLFCCWGTSVHIGRTATWSDKGSWKDLTITKVDLVHLIFTYVVSGLKEYSNSAWWSRAAKWAMATKLNLPQVSSLLNWSSNYTWIWMYLLDQFVKILSINFVAVAYKPLQKFPGDEWYIMLLIYIESDKIPLLHKLEQLYKCLPVGVLINIAYTATNVLHNLQHK